MALRELVPEQHFTQPPPRFTQASLIKELEEKGIGRPSTYASIMGTILNKEYVVEDEQQRLRPTELGMLVTDLLVESFPDVLNVEFTAGMEDELDHIEEGKEHWVAAMRRFWTPVREGPRARRGRDARREARGAPDRSGLREVRQAAWSSSGAGAASSSPAAAIPSAATPPTSRATRTGRSSPSSPS